MVQLLCEGLRNLGAAEFQHFVQSAALPSVRVRDSCARTKHVKFPKRVFVGGKKATLLVDGTMTTMTTALHLLPCEIDHSGPASVSNYFHPKPNEARGCIEAHFRGHLVSGTSVKLPAFSTCAVLIACDSEDAEDEGKKVWKVSERHDSFCVWNRDSNLNERSCVRQAVEWIGLARALHAPLRDEKGGEKPAS